MSARFAPRTRIQAASARHATVEIKNGAPSVVSRAPLPSGCQCRRMRSAPCQILTSAYRAVGWPGQCAPVSTIAGQAGVILHTNTSESRRIRGKSARQLVSRLPVGRCDSRLCGGLLLFAGLPISSGLGFVAALLLPRARLVRRAWYPVAVCVEVQDAGCGWLVALAVYASKV